MRVVPAEYQRRGAAEAAALRPDTVPLARISTSAMRRRRRSYRDWVSRCRPANAPRYERPGGPGDQSTMAANYCRVDNKDNATTLALRLYFNAAESAFRYPQSAPREGRIRLLQPAGRPRPSAGSTKSHGQLRVPAAPTGCNARFTGTPSGGTVCGTTCQDNGVVM